MTGNKTELIKWLYSQSNETLFEIKEYKHHRTLSQNAYVWKLINEIANQVGKTKEEVYFQMLKDYGQSEIISVKSNIDITGYFKYYEVICTIDKFTNYRIYKGSSEFTTLEMKYLLDGVIQECENLGIPTLTEEQISKMKLG